MDKENSPDISFETAILENLDLTEDQRAGAKIFLDAISSIKSIDEDFDIGDDFLPNRRHNGVTDQHKVATQAHLSEFYNSYVLVAYDMAGNRINIWSFPTEMAADANIINLKESLEICKNYVQNGKLKSSDE